MPGEYDEKFDLITGMLQKTVGGLDELRMEFRDMRKDIGDLKGEVRKNGERLDGVDNKLNVLAAQFADVGTMAIEDHDKTNDLERRVNILESEVH